MESNSHDLPAIPKISTEHGLAAGQDSTVNNDRVRGALGHDPTTFTEGTGL